MAANSFATEKKLCGVDRVQEKCEHRAMKMHLLSAYSMYTIYHTETRQSRSTQNNKARQLLRTVDQNTHAVYAQEVYTL